MNVENNNLNLKKHFENGELKSSMETKDLKKDNNMGFGQVWKSDESKNIDPLGKPVKVKKVRLPLGQKAAYSVGHVLNDLCASMWFTYLLLYFTMVLNFSNFNAGLLVLIGQVADAMATPVVGIASDRASGKQFCKYGRRKIWHLIGTVCVVISFPFLFIPCLGCEHTEHSMQMIYYASFIIVFQFGWASVQVAHLSLIPDLTKNPNEKTELNALRNAFTVVSSVCVYAITWVVIGVQSDSSSGNAGIGPEDVTKFRNIMFIVTSIGLVFSIIFHLGIREPKPVINEIQAKIAHQQNNLHTLEMNIQSSEHKELKKNTEMTWRLWLKSFEFYKVGVLYMCTRLFVNLSQTYITLYLQESLQLPKSSVAIIPLVVYISGFLASLIMKPLNKKAGRRISFVLGAAFAIAFCFWIFFGTGPSYTSYQLYGVAVFMGIGGTVMLVTCLSITADLIGDNVQCGAFVYGAMSFADKLSNGLVVVIIQDMHIGSNEFYRNVLAFGCGIPGIVALLTVFALSSTLVNSTRAKSTVCSEKVDPTALDHVPNGHTPTQLNETYKTNAEKY